MKTKERLAKLILKGGFVLDELSKSPKLCLIIPVAMAGLAYFLTNAEPPTRKQAQMPPQPLIENSTTNNISF